MDDEADGMLGVSSSFIWNEGFETFRGIPETFSGDTPGPRKDYDTPYDCFIDIWDKTIIERIVEETNRYATQTIDGIKDKGTLKPSSRLHKWTLTDADEIMVLYAVYMYMGIDPRTSQTEYWMSNEVLEMPRFKHMMTYNRYVLLFILWTILFRVWWRIVHKMKKILYHQNWQNLKTEGCLNQ